MKNKKGGLIKMIIILVIAIAIISWFGVDIKTFFTSPQAQKNFGDVWTFMKDVWSDYLAAPATWLWGILVEHVWLPIIKTLLK